MHEFVFSKHAIEQMERRTISVELVLAILENPKEIIFEEELAVYQSVIRFNNGKEYLVRIIVNSLRNPKVVVTAYRTSKLKKYES